MAGRRILVAALALLGLAVAPPPAFATFHLIYVREVYPGSLASPQAEYVELQMYASGQNHLHGHTLSFFGASGAPSGSTTFAADVAGSANQSTVLVATPAAESQFGIAADAAMPGGSLDPSGGAACWEALDCVAWGDFHGSASSPVGSPADPAGIPDGMALRRTIAPGCPTLLEQSDDSNDSATDFFDAPPAPRPNSVAPSEHACTAASEGSGESPAHGGTAPGGSAAGRAPQTSIRSGPRHRTHKRSATFRFAASEAGSTFLCSLDGRPFKACRSPYTVRGLRPGRHVLRVEARRPGGPIDPSPASWSFRVLAKKR